MYQLSAAARLIKYARRLSDRGATFEQAMTAFATHNVPGTHLAVEARPVVQKPRIWRNK